MAERLGYTTELANENAELRAKLAEAERDRTAAETRQNELIDIADRAETRLAEAEAREKALRQTALNVLADNGQIIEALTTAREALRKYGQHTFSEHGLCKASPASSMRGDCTCGLDAALAATEPSNG